VKVKLTEARLPDIINRLAMFHATRLFFKESKRKTVRWRGESKASRETQSEIR